jgi:hypothetical protein
MINPEYKARWRPKSDLGARHELKPDYLPLEAYEPTDADDALTYLRELALPELVAYDGDACQTDLMRETAARRWSHLFPNVVVTEPIVREVPGGVHYANA